MRNTTWVDGSRLEKWEGGSSGGVLVAGREHTTALVVASFLLALDTNGRMQPVVMAPKNLSIKQK